jgi:hypothetical protein
VLLRIIVTVTDAAGNAVPVPRAQLLISDNPSTSEPRRVRTGADGTIEVKVAPGNYTVESDVPVRLGARAYAWTQTLDVLPGRETVLELTAANADTDVDATAIATDAGAATPADGAVILNKWQASVAEIWTPMRHATGFVIDARGLIATSDRALGEAAEVEVEFGSGADRVKVAGRVIASERVKGVTLVWVDPSITKTRPPIAPSCATPQPEPIAHDDNVVALIAPVLEPKTALPGSAIRPGLQSFRADWNIDDTSAGGPVFAADGTPIGITVGYTEDEQASRQRRDAYVIPLHNACSVIAAAEPRMAGAKPPAPTPLRTEAGLPPRRTARMGDPQKPAMMPPLIRADDYDVSLMTPAMVNADRTTSNTRNYFGYWMPYLAAAPDVLLVRVSPQFEESLWRTIARGAASTQGVALPPMPSFSANFGRMRAFCGNAEVMPLRRFIVETPVDKRNPIREGVYVFALSDFGPACGTVRFELFSEKSPAKGDTRTVDPAIFTRIAEASR